MIVSLSVKIVDHAILTDQDVMIQITILLQLKKVMNTTQVQRHGVKVHGVAKTILVEIHGLAKKNLTIPVRINQVTPGATKTSLTILGAMKTKISQTIFGGMTKKASQAIHGAIIATKTNQAILGKIKKNSQTHLEPQKTNKRTGLPMIGMAKQTSQVLQIGMIQMEILKDLTAAFHLTTMMVNIPARELTDPKLLKKVCIFVYCINRVFNLSILDPYLYCKLLQKSDHFSIV